jgi:hypothetical protein
MAIEGVGCHAGKGGGGQAVDPVLARSQRPAGAAALRHECNLPPVFAALRHECNLPPVSEPPQTEPPSPTDPPLPHFYQP